MAEKRKSTRRPKVTEAPAESSSAQHMKGAPALARRKERAQYRILPCRLFDDPEWRELSPTARVIWLTLVGGPGSLPVPGLFRMGRLALSEALGVSLDVFDDGWAELERAGRAAADWKALVCWLPGVLKLPRLRPDNGNVIQGYRRWWEEIPPSGLKSSWIAELKEHAGERGPHFEAGVRRGFGDVFELPEGYGEGSPGVTPNQDQDQDQQQDQQQEGERAGARGEPPPPPEQVQGEDGAGAPKALLGLQGSDEVLAGECRLGVPVAFQLGPDALLIAAIFAEKTRRTFPMLSPGRAAQQRRQALEDLGGFVRGLASEAEHEAVKKGWIAERAFERVGKGMVRQWLKYAGSDGHYLLDRGHPIEDLVGRDAQNFGLKAQQTYLRKLAEAGVQEPPRLLVPVVDHFEPPHVAAEPPNEVAAARFVVDIYAEEFVKERGTKPDVHADDLVDAAAIYKLIHGIAESSAHLRPGMATELLYEAIGRVLDRHEMGGLKAVRAALESLPKGVHKAQAEQGNGFNHGVVNRAMGE